MDISNQYRIIHQVFYSVIRLLIVHKLDECLIKITRYYKTPVNFDQLIYIVESVYYRNMKQLSLLIKQSMCYQ